MMIQAKRLKDNLKKVGAQGPYKLHVTTEVNYKNGNIGKAHSLICPLSIEQEKQLRELDNLINIIKVDGSSYWLVESY